MDFRKIIFYLLIILAALGYWHKSGRDKQARMAEYDRFASVYAGTSVMAELYRNEPERFFAARDSIYALYKVSADSLNAFKAGFENREEDWSEIWKIIKDKSDSLITYYKEHPVAHNLPDSTDLPDDSAISRGR